MEEALARRPWWQPADPADAACGRFELWWGGNAQRYPATVFRSGTAPAVACGAHAEQLDTCSTQLIAAPSPSLPLATASAEEPWDLLWSCMAGPYMYTAYGAVS